MTATVATVAYLGLEARPVEVQVQLSAGLPRITIVGLPDKAVAESRERVHAALASLRITRLACRDLCSIASIFMSMYRACLRLTSPYRRRRRAVRTSRAAYHARVRCRRTGTMDPASGRMRRRTVSCSIALRRRTTRDASCLPTRRQRCAGPPAASTGCFAWREPWLTLPG